MNLTRSKWNLTLEAILNKLEKHFKTTYKDDLEKIILFGSQARGEARADSDIDILVILKNQFDSYQENKKNSYFVSELCLQYDAVISCFLINSTKWHSGNNAFIRNVKREGISL